MTSVALPNGITLKEIKSTASAFVLKYNEIEVTEVQIRRHLEKSYDLDRNALEQADIIKKLSTIFSSIRTEKLEEHASKENADQNMSDTNRSKKRKRGLPKPVMNDSESTNSPRKKKRKIIIKRTPKKTTTPASPQSPRRIIKIKRKPTTPKRANKYVTIKKKSNMKKKTEVTPKKNTDVEIDDYVPPEETVAKKTKTPKKGKTTKKQEETLKRVARKTKLLKEIGVHPGPMARMTPDERHEKVKDLMEQYGASFSLSKKEREALKDKITTQRELDDLLKTRYYQKQDIKLDEDTEGPSTRRRSKINFKPEVDYGLSDEEVSFDE